MTDLEFVVTLQKETKSFVVYERREGDVIGAILYLPRAVYSGQNPKTLHVTVSR